MREELMEGRRFPLILLDAQMPGVDGFALAETVQNDPAIAPAAIMMLSSSDLHEDAQRCRDLGIASYLVKPINQTELCQAILKTLAARPQSELDSLALTVAGGALPVVVSPPPQRCLDVLLVEDNVVNQKLILHVLAKRKYLVTVAGNGLLAVEALEHRPFDLVLMDIQMPEMGGIEATKIIRATEAKTGAHTPIVALTAHAMKGDRERCLEAGMDGYLSKPVKSRDLFDAIDRLVPLAPLSPALR
jgi:CheY-like chemotaxis protein